MPRGCVPYLPCAIGTLLRLVDEAGITDADVVVDVGSGVGRAALVLRLVTGARVIGIEIQPPLVECAREHAARLRTEVTFFTSDAAALGHETIGASVYFLYCPFGGAHLAAFLDRLAARYETRPFRIATVDMPDLDAAWLVPVAAASPELRLYRSSA